MRFPSRKVPLFEPMRMAKGTRCPYVLDSNTIPFHASASKAPICTSEESCATCAARDNGRSRARKIAGCSHRAPRRRTRCLYRRSPVPWWLIARVIARERLPVDLLASFICGSAHFEAVADSGSMELPRTRTEFLAGQVDLPERLTMMVSSSSVFVNRLTARRVGRELPERRQNLRRPRRRLSSPSPSGRHPPRRRRAGWSERR